MDFFPEIHIGAGEAEAIARGLYAVARAEGGVHEREAAMIAGFYGEAAGDGARQLAALASAPDLDPEQLALSIGNREVRLLFLKTALLVAWADNSYGTAEQALIHKYAAALGVDEASLGQLEQSVKEFLLGQIVHLSDVEAQRQVAKKLSL